MQRNPNHLSIVLLVECAENEERLTTLPSAMQSHLGACTQCTGKLAWLTRAIGLMRTDASEDAPPAAVARAIRFFRPMLTPTSPSLRVHLLAVLRLDTGQQTLATGLRAGHVASRQLLYSAGEYELDLRVSQAESGWRLAGQVLGTDIEGWVTLSGATVRSVTPLDELGEFNLHPVPAGPYRLDMHLGKVDIEVRNLEIGSLDATN